MFAGIPHTPRVASPLVLQLVRGDLKTGFRVQRCRWKGGSTKDYSHKVTVLRAVVGTPPKSDVLHQQPKINVICSFWACPGTGGRTFLPLVIRSVCSSRSVSLRPDELAGATGPAKMTHNNLNWLLHTATTISANSTYMTQQSHYNKAQLQVKLRSSVLA